MKNYLVMPPSSILAVARLPRKLERESMRFDFPFSSSSGPWWDDYAKRKNCLSFAEKKGGTALDRVYDNQRKGEEDQMKKSMRKKEDGVKR